MIAAGLTSNETICHVDFLATVAALVDVTLPSNAGEDSHNLLPVLRGENYTRPHREATVHHSGSGRFAIRKGNWVLIAAPGGDDNGGPKKGSEPDWFRSAPGYDVPAPESQLYDLPTIPPSGRTRPASIPTSSANCKPCSRGISRTGAARPASRSRTTCRSNHAACRSVPVPVAIVATVPCGHFSSLACYHSQMPSLLALTHAAPAW